MTNSIPIEISRLPLAKKTGEWSVQIDIAGITVEEARRLRSLVTEISDAIRSRGGIRGGCVR